MTYSRIGTANSRAMLVKNRSFSMLRPFKQLASLVSMDRLRAGNSRAINIYNVTLREADSIEAVCGNLEESIP